MKATEAIDLAKRMRKAQKVFYAINAKVDPEKKMDALFAAKKLEKEFDNADIEDIANLVTDSPIA